MISQHSRYNLSEWETAESQSWWAHIYVGGDMRESETVCRGLCFPSGLCVTVEKVKYVFAGGTEEGVRIGMIQYPPFHEPEEELFNKAIKVGKAVAEANSQWSFTIVTNNKNIFLTRRGK